MPTMSKPRYDRETRTFTQAEIDLALSQDLAKAFETANGTLYVVKLPEGGSIKVTSDMIVADGPVVGFPDPEATQAAAELAQSSIQDYIAKAAAAGCSVEEYTDGEYYVNNGRVFSAEERHRHLAERAARPVSKFDRMDAALGRFL